jgi:hypothetical protein
MAEMIRYPALEATPDDVAARAYKGAVSFALREVERVESNLARAMAAEPPEGWYLSVLRSELRHVKVFLAALVGANSNLNGFTVAGDGWVAALRALLSEGPAPSEPAQCLHHDGAGNPAHVPGCTICPYSPFNGEACAALGTVPVVTPGSDHTSTLVCEEHLPHYLGGGWVEEDDGRCPHGYFRSGAGSCPMCAA